MIGCACTEIKSLVFLLSLHYQTNSPPLFPLYTTIFKMKTQTKGTTKKRNRAFASCIPCHNRHIKCSRTIPCLSCIQGDRRDECRFFHDLPRGETSSSISCIPLTARTFSVNSLQMTTEGEKRRNACKVMLQPSLHRKQSDPQRSFASGSTPKSASFVAERPFARFLSEVSQCIIDCDVEKEV